MKKFLNIFFVVICCFLYFSPESNAAKFLIGYSFGMVNQHCPNEDLWKYNIVGGPTNGSCSSCPKTIQEIPQGYIKNADKYDITDEIVTNNHSCQNTGTNQFVSACTLTYKVYTLKKEVPGDDNGGIGTITNPTCSHNALCGWGLPQSSHNTANHPYTVTGGNICNTCEQYTLLTCDAVNCGHNALCNSRYTRIQHGTTVHPNIVTGGATCSICHNYISLTCEASAEQDCPGPVESDCTSHYAAPSGDPNASVSDTNIKLAELKKKFYQIGDEVELIGNHHTARTVTVPSHLETATCQNSATFICSINGPDCMVHSPYTNTCGRACQRTVYDAPVYTENIHPVIFAFKGFTVEPSNITIFPNPSVGESNNTVVELQENIKIKSLVYSALDYEESTARPYGVITAKCNIDGCSCYAEQKIYFAFTSEVVNGDFSKALRAVTVHDLRWQSYFANGGDPYFLSKSKNILVDNSKSPQVQVDTLKSGYAVKFALNTINTSLNNNGMVKDDIYLEVDVNIYEYDNYNSTIGNKIEFNKISDVTANPSAPLSDNKYSLYRSFTSKDSVAVNKFLIKPEKDGDNEIRWNWVYYLPPALKLADSNSYQILIKSDIKLKIGEKTLWSYVDVLNKTNTTSWDGYLFKYHTNQSLLQDIGSGVSY